MTNVVIQAGIQGDCVPVPHMAMAYELLTNPSQYVAPYAGIQHSQTSPYRGSPVEMASPQSGTM